jgi:hypothetical protein
VALNASRQQAKISRGNVRRGPGTDEETFRIRGAFQGGLTLELLFLRQSTVFFSNVSPVRTQDAPFLQKKLYRPQHRRRQSCLLALNASIEAARAPEHGTGGKLCSRAETVLQKLATNGGGPVGAFAKLAL